MLLLLSLLLLLLSLLSRGIAALGFCCLPASFLFVLQLKLRAYPEYDYGLRTTDYSN